MTKFVLIPDSFKGTMSSTEICEIMKKSILSHFPQAEVVSVPVADGGEGSVDAFLSAVGGERVSVRVKGPFMQEMDAFYGLIDGGKTAVIEMAACAGLPLVKGNKNPATTTTYGVGQLMDDAARRGVSKIVLGLGGSATNDMGAGAAAALGVRFLNGKGEEFIPTGGTLADIGRVDVSGRLPALAGIEIVAMCDISNPLYGETGAAHVFGPQKGADAEMVAFLDEQLRRGEQAVRNSLGLSLADMQGAGAAGGMGYGMAAFLGAKLQMGIETVLKTVGFDALAKDADMVFTGEGRIDTQSLKGKVVIGVARAAKALGVPVVAVVGDIGDQIEAAYGEGVSAVFSTNRIVMDMATARVRAKGDMALTMDSIMRLIKASNHI